MLRFEGQGHNSLCECDIPISLKTPTKAPKARVKRTTPLMNRIVTLKSITTQNTISRIYN